MPDKYIVPEKFNKVVTDEVKKVLWDISQGDMETALGLARDLYIRGFKVVKLESGE